MRRYITWIFALISSFVAPQAFAANVMEPTHLSQSAGGQPVPVGGHVAAGTTIELQATPQCAPGYNYSLSLQIEILEESQPFHPFRRGRTEQRYMIRCGQPFPPIAVSLISGSWKWRARQVFSTSGGGGGGGEGGSGGSWSRTEYSDWVYFNGESAAFTVDPTPIPDLLVSSVELTNASSDTAQDVLSLEWTATLRNLGAQPSGTFSWRAWLSTDWILDPSDQPIFTSAPLNIGAESSVVVTGAANVTPGPVPGHYYLIIEADAANSVAEFDETNNSRYATRTFLKGVDLVADVMGFPAELAGPGDTLTLDIGFANQGIDSPPAAQSVVEFRILVSRDEYPDPTDIEVYSNTVTVSAGTRFQAPVTFTVPQNVPEGYVFWLLEVDPGNGVTEVDETNNVNLTGLTLIQKADLKVLSARMLDVSTGASTVRGDVGGLARFQAQVQNDGEHAAGDFRMGVMLSVNDVPSLIQDEIIAEVSVSGLQAGATRTEDFVVTLPTTFKGKPLDTGLYHLFLFVDSRDEVGERNELNNVSDAIGPVLLRRPTADYLATWVSTPAQVAAGETCALNLTVANVGTADGAPVEYRCYASANDTISTADSPLTFVDGAGAPVPARSIQLARNERRTVSETVLLPATLPDGAYHLGCIVDPTDAVPELDESNNAVATAWPVQVSAQDFQIVTRYLPHATIGIPYNVRLAVKGAQGPVTFALSGPDSAPEGIRLDPDGTLRGIPTRPGESRFMVRATSGSASYERLFSLKVIPTTTDLAIMTDGLPPLIEGSVEPYQAVLSAAGGVAPYLWTLDDEALPPGLELDSASGYITGVTDSLPVDVTLTFRVRDFAGAVATKKLKLRSYPPGSLIISSRPLPDALARKFYTASLSAEMLFGGDLAKPLTWSIAEGTLPPGLKLSTHADAQTGMVIGTPEVAGLFPLTVQVSDAHGRSDTRGFVLQVHASQLRVYSNSIPGALAPNERVAFQILSSGTDTARFQLFAGTLPPGLALQEDGNVIGAVAGDPAAIGRFTFVVEAVDAHGGRGLGVFTLDVLPPDTSTGCGCASGSNGFPPLLWLAMVIQVLALSARTRPGAPRPARLRPR